MKKTLLFFILLISHYLSCQVIIDGITVNGASAYGTINLNPNISTSNIYINVSIQVPVSPVDTNYPGSLTIYYKTSNAFSPIVANGGQSIPIQFLGGTFISRSFYISLINNSFQESGGYLYAEYKNYNSTTILKSANINITKTSGVQPGNPGGGGGGCSDCYSEKVPYGGVPLLPYSDLINQPLYKWYILTPYGESEIGPYEDVSDNRKTLYERLYLRLRYENNYLMKYTASVDRPYSRSDNYISRLIIDNSISGTQDVIYGGTPQTIFGNNATVNNTANNTYQWQERIVKKHCDCGEGDYKQWSEIYGWKNIPGATLVNYTPPSNHTKTKEYRRLIFDNYGIPMASNVETIYSISTDSVIDTTNLICCNKIYFPNDPISPIIGQNVDLYHYIQWQEGKIINGNIMEWRTLADDISKDKVPYTTLNRRNPRPYSSTAYYRRVLTHRFNGKLYVSNTVAINYTNINSNRKIYSQSNKELLNIDSIFIYPNPSSSIINIESEHDLSSFNAKIIDVTGRLILKNNYELSGYSTQLNISDLPTGIYTIIIENGQDKIIKKLIKK